MNDSVYKRILIYRLGSLGDTIVALPALRLIERAFPNAERWMLTNIIANSKAVPAAQVLDGTGLVHGYLEYPEGLRKPSKLMEVRSEIRQLRPEMLVYLAAPRGILKLFRDEIFFRACGIRQIIGIPYSTDLRQPHVFSNGLYEYEGSRLLRCLAALGGAKFDKGTPSWLDLNDLERATAQRILAPLAKRKPMIAVSIGAKVEVKDWGDGNWSELLRRLNHLYRGAGLIMLGAEIEHARSKALLGYWNGAALNLCGQLSVRESAAVLEQADVFLGHDSGPMHLAASVGVPCVAIFSSSNLPGVWFPQGEQHKVLYTQIDCQGCKLDVCPAHDKACIRSISVDQVERQIHNALRNSEQVVKR